MNSYIYNKVKKNVRGAVLAVLLCMSSLPVMAADDNNYDMGGAYADTWSVLYATKVAQGAFSWDTPFEGAGSLYDPYRITTVWDLCRLERNVNAGNNYINKYFRLDADIDLSEATWTPVGVDGDACFAGNFDGNGHTVKGMHLSIANGTAEKNYYHGFFGSMKGIVRNLKLTDASITISQDATNTKQWLCAGLLCGYMGYDTEAGSFTWGVNTFNGTYGTLYNCDVQGTISGKAERDGGTYTTSYVGGMVGFVQNPCGIYHCHAQVTMTIGNVHEVGGLVGHLRYYPKTITHDNTLTTPVESYVYDCTADVDISTSYVMNYSSTDNNNYTGGICGFNQGGNLLACGSMGTLKQLSPIAEGVGTTGGMAGRNEGHIVGCASLAGMTGQYVLGGIVGRNSELEIDGTVYFTGTVLCSVFSGYLGGVSFSAGGIEGLNDPDPDGEMTTSVLRNNLMLGTIQSGSTNSYAVSEATKTTVMQYNYCDYNLYDDETSEASQFRSTTHLTSGQSSAASFQQQWRFKPLWLYYKGRDAVTLRVDTLFQWKEGFYPRLNVGQKSVLSSDQYNSNDNILTRYGQAYDEVNMKPYQTWLFPAYAWLASVPIGLHKGCTAQCVDMPLSLAPKQETLNAAGDLKTATFTLTSGQSLFAVTEQTATPVARGEAVMTVSTPDGVKKALLLQADPGTTWDGHVAREYSGGSGTSASPYLIYNARQMTRALRDNTADEHYKLARDVWYNEDLLADNALVNADKTGLDHQGKTDSYRWKAHIDGDGHQVHGLYTTNAYGLVEGIDEDAVIENIAFVNSCVQTKPSTNENHYAAFLSPGIAGSAVVRNCMFEGSFLRNFTLQSEGIYTAALCRSVADGATIEDCIVAVTAQNTIDFGRLAMDAGLFGDFNQSGMGNVKRILVLNDNGAHRGLTSKSDYQLTGCYYPKGYLFYPEAPYAGNPRYNYYLDSKTVESMTDGTFFAGQERWLSSKGRFPMLKSFAGTPYANLLSLPVYCDDDNGLSRISAMLDFEASRATWFSTSEGVAVDGDIRVIEPMNADATAYVVRTMDGAKVSTPVTVGQQFSKGVTFEDPEVERFCLEHYNTNGDQVITLDELKTVTLAQLEADMDENDGDPSDNDGELIERFPEFRYFAGISQLGKAFQGKEKLQSLGLSGKIGTLTANAFMGDEALESFTVPVTVTDIGEHPFYNSGLQNFDVDMDHDAYATLDGVLVNKDKNRLVCYPNGRTGTSISLAEDVKGVDAHAIYRIAGVDSLFIYVADYDYTTVVDFADQAVTHADDSKQMLYCVEDATFDYNADDDDSGYEDDPGFAPAPRRALPITGTGKGKLLYQYVKKYPEKTFARFYDVEFSERSKDTEKNCYWATMYIGFDTQLPDDVTPYIVDKQKTQTSSSTLVLRQISRKVPKGTPVVLKSQRAGKVHLEPSKDEKAWAALPMSENLLDGVGEDGLAVYQSDSNDGGCLTLGKNASGELGFFIYKGKDAILPYRAYLSVNKVSDARALLVTFDEESTAIDDVRCDEHVPTSYYNLQGQRVERSTRGIYVVNGKKVFVDGR